MIFEGRIFELCGMFQAWDSLCAVCDSRGVGFSGRGIFEMHGIGVIRGVWDFRGVGSSRCTGGVIRGVWDFRGVGSVDASDSRVCGIRGVWDFPWDLRDAWDL